MTVAKTRVVENHHTTESRGSNQAVRDSDHKLLYTRSAAKVISTADDVSKTVHYTRDAARVTTAVEESSKTLLDIRA